MSKRRYYKGKTPPTFECKGCGATISRRRDMLLGERAGGWDYRQKYCTSDCFHRTRFASHEASRLEGVFPRGHVNSDGYRVIKLAHGRVEKEHRLVMTRVLGRPLRKTENIHHKNGNRADNSSENLELWVKTQPCGQRVEDKVAAAVQLLLAYPEFAKRAGYSLSEVEIEK